jgi:hypothetical protein
MKTILSLFVIAGITLFVACSGSDKAKVKAKLDSVYAVEKSKSIADSIDAIEKTNHKLDSLKKDSIKKTEKVKKHHSNKAKSKHINNAHK